MRDAAAPVKRPLSGESVDGPASREANESKPRPDSHAPCSRDAESLVRAYEDVQSVVERNAIEHYTPSPASKLLARFVNRHRDARIDEGHSRGEARIAAADDGDVHGKGRES